ncbi:DUF3592 domain-containing protein [Rufibacter psychrotolerans]|uniref:DUF3592 domain-containing protein n=1 Tax=Rufibacter psychrotolerans TaxID=2812556 RepID=UPI0019671AA4|nr:DUF3592 domain-containing protein [Rufibacter sp. SYSU D00308]
MTREAHHKKKVESIESNKFQSSLWFCCIVLVLWFLYIDTPDSVLFAKEGFQRWLPFILVFLGLPYLLLKFVNSVWSNNSGWGIGVAAASVLIVGPTFGIVAGKQQQKELEKNGALTKGLVVEKWKSTSKGNKEWLIICKYYANGRAYTTFSIPDKENRFKLGDTVTVLYSPNNPNNSEVAELSDIK